MRRIFRVYLSTGEYFDISESDILSFRGPNIWSLSRLDPSGRSIEIAHSGNAVLAQSIGLKSSQGEEIFEGDTVQFDAYGETVKGTVIWDEKGAAFLAITDENSNNALARGPFFMSHVCGFLSRSIIVGRASPERPVQQEPFNRTPQVEPVEILVDSVERIFDSSLIGGDNAFYLYLKQQKEAGDIVTFQELTATELERLVWEGLIDSEIASLFGVSKQDVSRKRTRLGIRKIGFPMIAQYGGDKYPFKEYVPDPHNVPHAKNQRVYAAGSRVLSAGIKNPEPAIYCPLTRKWSRGALMLVPVRMCLSCENCGTAFAMDTLPENIQCFGKGSNCSLPPKRHRVDLSGWYFPDKI